MKEPEKERLAVMNNPFVWTMVGMRQGDLKFVFEEDGSTDVYNVVNDRKEDFPIYKVGELKF